MLFCSLKTYEIPELVRKSQIGIELRLDLMPSLNLQKTKEFLERAGVPVLCTLRKKDDISEETREEKIEELLALNPTFFDLEMDLREEFLRRVLHAYQKTKIILSHHDWQGVPSNLDALYKKMASFDAFAYKIAATPSSVPETLRFLSQTKRYPRLSLIAMGMERQWSRVVGGVMGNALAYAGGEEIAPGQLTLKEMVETYRYLSLQKKTRIYALIGNPITKSRGHLYHNAFFGKQGIDALYVKIALPPEELEEFLVLAPELGFFGCSVTMPLKEKVLPFIDALDAEAATIGAVNTLKWEGRCLFGTNTDGKGALDALEEKLMVAGKRIVLLGAGGAARAIAFEAKRRGADVLLLNRTQERARGVAEELGVQWASLSAIKEEYDAVVNCTPDPMPVEASDLQEGKVTMDISITPTPFLEAAFKKASPLVYGEEMFVRQAARQSHFWFGESLCNP
ncbi:MAG: shikimate dehydrogenase [Verrucomicrobiota bacterium]|nr:shikimate dehydrogenase [Verrucomicrobiota bacterium]